MAGRRAAWVSSVWSCRGHSVGGLGSSLLQSARTTHYLAPNPWLWYFAAESRLAAHYERTTLPVEVLKISHESPERETVLYAAGFILRGRVVGIPTDTFYGLSADPFNLAAVEEVFKVKGRPEAKALPILVNSMEQAATLARDVSDTFLKLAGKFWPGALTIVVDATNKLPLKITGNSGCVALRWPNSRIASDLIDAVGGPVTGTSANLSGFPACTNAGQLVKQLGDRLPLILDSGDTGAVLASTIVGLNGEQWWVAREGAVPEAEIHQALQP